MRKRLSSVVALAAIASLTACGGGSGSGGNALPAAPNPSPVLQDVQFRITIPQSTRLLPKYISGSTKSASIQVAPTGGTPLTPVTVNCTTSCSATIAAPVGSDQFTVKLYDAANAAGNVLSQGTATQTIAAGTANSVNLTFGGVVAAIAVMLAQNTISAAGTVGVTVAAKDAANQTIVGSAPYNNPIALTDTDASGTTSLSTTTVTSPATVVTLTYNGGAAFSSAVIGASATGVSPSGVTGATLTKAAGGSSGGAIAFLSSGVGTISASSTAATVVAISEYQTAIGSAPADVPSTDQGSIALQIGSTLTPLGALRQTLGAPPVQSTAQDDAPGYRGTFRDSPISDDWNAKYSKNLTPFIAAPHRTVTTKALPTVGTVQSFYISSSAIGSSGGGYKSVPFTLAATSTHTLVWLDNSLSSTVMGYANQIAADSENAYLSDTAKYAPFDYTTAASGLNLFGGNYCDNSGAKLGTQGAAFIDPPAPGIVNVMVANGAPSGPLGGGVGGYFSSLNYLNQSYANCYSGGQAANPSNQLPMIVVGWFSDGTASGDQYALNEDLVRGTAHELQHLINFVNHTIINGQQNNDPRWLNEGMSMLAQDLASTGGIDIDDSFNHATSYLAHPQENSLTGFLRIVSGSTPTLAYNCGSCYGGSYLFVRYMYDRFGGNSFTQSMTTGNTNGHASLVRLSSYSDFPSLLGDFATALAVSNTGVSTDPRYNFTGINLHHTYASPTGRASEVFNGPALLPVGAGSSAAITGMPAGAFAYYTVTGLTGSGNSVKLTDTTTGTSPMALTGSIVQH